MAMFVYVANAKAVNKPLFTNELKTTSKGV